MLQNTLKMDSRRSDTSMKGWLCKWTNYLKGYQRRWFVLSNGVLSYYRNQAEMSHTCRGSIRLPGAVISIDDSCTFVVSNGNTQTFHLRAATEVERQKWVTALELAKKEAQQHEMESDEEEEYEGLAANQKTELSSDITLLAAKLDDLKTCKELVERRKVSLLRSLSELESLDCAGDIPLKKTVNEKATLFRIASASMVQTSEDYLTLAQQQGKKWQKMLQYERDQRQRLEEVVEQLAKQHVHLEQAAKGHRIARPGMPHSSPSDEDEDNEFYDAQSDQSHSETQQNFVLKIPMGHRRTSSAASLGSQGADDGQRDSRDQASGSSSDVDDTAETKAYFIVDQEGSSTQDGSDIQGNSKNAASVSSKKAVTSSMNSPSSDSMSTSAVARKRRSRVPDKPNHPLSLWSIMKNCIGKELSKIPMPVNFSEPLSMLQRLTEIYEYSDLLDKAGACSDDYEQLALVAAFTVSTYAGTSNRTGKPFNPLLGETYECDRRGDLGWRCISEQVSHHPPMVAQFCEGRGWRCWQEFSMSSKFRGKYLLVIPLGTSHLEFDGSGNHYTWRGVTTTVNNIIVGKLWVDQYGDMDIINHKNGSKCHLKYVPYSYFTRDTQRKVKGCVMDSEGKVKWVINGTWDEKLEIAAVTSVEGDRNNPVYHTGPYKVVWQRKPLPPDSEKMYNFTEFACQLNEEEEGIAPTDSRLRPDQRLMENQLWDQANTEKLRLEEKQRAVRRQREAEAKAAAAEGRSYLTHEPLWFKKQEDPYTNTAIFTYQGKYWDCKEKQDWENCPDIFGVP